MCRDGSGAYGEAVRRALPGAVQVGDRWHLWHGLGEAVRKEVAAYSACWAQAGPVKSGRRAETTLERWQQVHDLLCKGVGLLDCARRLDLALNTVKRYARADRPERLQRAPQYRPTLVDPYRDHLRKRRAGDPAVPVQQLLREIRELGYQGSSNLLVRYINQGRAEGDRPHLSPRQAARILLTRVTGVPFAASSEFTAGRVPYAGALTGWSSTITPRSWPIDAGTPRCCGGTLRNPGSVCGVPVMYRDEGPAFGLNVTKVGSPVAAKSAVQ